MRTGDPAGYDVHLRRDPDSVVIPFDERTHDARLDPRDAILSLAVWPAHSRFYYRGTRNGRIGRVQDTASYICESCGEEIVTPN